MKIRKILFVCLGNICRSPLAEELFRFHVISSGKAEAYQIDSCGTAAYHIGSLADHRTRANASKHGVELTHKARQFKRSDFEEFDMILVMDSSNHLNILSLANSQEEKNKIYYLRDFDSMANGEKEVPDPYYGTEMDFENVFQIVSRSTKTLLEKIEQNKI